MKRNSSKPPTYWLRMRWITRKIWVVFAWLSFAVMNEAVSDAIGDIQSKAVNAYFAKQFNECKQLLESIIEDDAQNMSLRKLLVECAWGSGDIETVVDEGESFLRVADDNFIRLMVARAYEFSGDHQKAYASYQRIENNPQGGYVEDTVEPIQRINGILLWQDQIGRPLQGFHGQFLTRYVHNDNIASAVDSGSEPPSDTAASGFNYDGTLSFEDHFFGRFNWGVSARGLVNFWTGSADQLDQQQIGGNVHVGVLGDRWHARMAYKNETNIFDGQFSRIRNGGELQLNYAIVPFAWYSSLSTGVFFDDFKGNRDANATVYETSVDNTVYDYCESCQKWGHYYGAYTYRRNQAISIFGYDSHIATLSWFRPTEFWALDLNITGSFERRVYDEPNPSDRRDNIIFLHVGVTKAWEPPELLPMDIDGDSIVTEISFQYYRTSSSVDFFDKIERIINVGIQYHF